MRADEGYGGKSEAYLQKFSIIEDKYHSSLRETRPRVVSNCARIKLVITSLFEAAAYRV